MSKTFSVCLLGFFDDVNYKAHEEHCVQHGVSRKKWKFSLPGPCKTPRLGSSEEPVVCTLCGQSFKYEQGRTPQG